MSTIYLYEPLNRKMPTQQQCLGSLPDAISCEIQRDITGLFTLELTYPLTGKRAEELQLRRWLSADAGGDLGYQLFEIVSMETADPGEIYIQANHASYVAKYIIAAPFTAVPNDITADWSTTVQCDRWINALEVAGFRISIEQWGDVSLHGANELLVNAARYTEPVTVYQAVSDAVEGRDDLFLLPSNFQLRLWSYTPLEDPHFTLRYGKNMKEFGQSSNLDDFYTAVFPYAVTSEGKFISYNYERFQLNDLPDSLQNSFYTVPLNLNGLYLYDPDQSDMSVFEIVYKRWLSENPFTAPAVETTVSAAEDAANHFELGLTGLIHYEPFDFTAKTAITSMTYDPLSERVTSVSVGGVPKTVLNDIAGVRPTEKTLG